MTSADELLPLVNQILNRVEEDSSELERWKQTEEGQRVVQYVFQIGKYNTNVGEGKDISIGDRLDQKVLEEVRDLLKSQLPSPPLEIDWQQINRTLLEERLQLTTNPMTRGEDIAYQVEQVYVPLGLMERKKVPRRKQDVSPEQGSALYQDQEDWQLERSPKKSEFSHEAEQEQGIEITQRFEHEQFLEQVLQQGQSPKSQGKRIAVIGEPGAGKTTLLQQIAQWAAATFSDSIVIWISLADLQSDSLETYLEKRWLQRVIRAAGGAEPSQADKTHFAAQFKQGRVWLLLDGLDEMQVSGNPLTEIQRQLQEGGWLQQARILLTCRLNLWDGDRNSLTQFDTYRTLEFAYPDQVEQFVRQWFVPRRKADLSEALCTALKESGRERIRDLVKNPLRLTLLCFNWYLYQGQLPETQAELYQRFVERIYKWKQEQFPTTLTQRQQLNRALAELSKEAIDTDTQEQTRFRVRQTFVNRFLQQSAPREPQPLLDLALKIGWLNQVGVDADDPTQAVYAFYHPTFEEYFAALGIDDGRFFLNPKPRNAKEANVAYRIFEPQWRQVFLLWLGRKDVDKVQKDALIRSMMKFNDRCGEFYSDRTFLLATVGISEFKDCTHADVLIDQLMQWKFGNVNRLEQVWANLVAPTRLEARAGWAETTFSNTDSQRVIRALVRVLKTTQDASTRTEAAKSLGNIGMGNETAIQALARMLETAQDVGLWKAIESLGNIGMGNETAIQALVRMLETAQDVGTLWRAIESLGNIGMGNETAIQALVRVLETTYDTYTRKIAASSLGNIGMGNEAAIQALVRVLETTHDTYTRERAASSLGNIDPGNEMAIRALVRVLENSQNAFTRWSTASSLGNIDPGNETAIRALVRVLENSQDVGTRMRAASSLGNIGMGNETAIRALVRVLETTYDTYTRKIAASSLGNIGMGNEAAIQALVRVLETAHDTYTRMSAAEILSNIDPGNEAAIQALVRVLETTYDTYTRKIAASSLGNIGMGNEAAIQALVRVLETTHDTYTRMSAASSLGNIDPGNETAIGELVRVLETTHDTYTRMSAASSLGDIGMNSEETSRVLVRSLRRHLRTKESYQLMMKCAETLPYLEFFQAFHSH